MSDSSTSSGIGVFGLLGVVFVTLKLLGYISWSWWWVTAPFWGVTALVLVILALAVVWLIIFSILGALFRSKPKPKVRPFSRY